MQYPYKHQKSYGNLDKAFYCLSFYNLYIHSYMDLDDFDPSWYTDAFHFHMGLFFDLHNMVQSPFQQIGHLSYTIVFAKMHHIIINASNYALIPRNLNLAIIYNLLSYLENISNNLIYLLQNPLRLINIQDHTHISFSNMQVEIHLM